MNLFIFLTLSGVSIGVSVEVFIKTSNNYLKFVFVFNQKVFLNGDQSWLTSVVRWEIICKVERRRQICICPSMFQIAQALPRQRNYF